MSVFTDIRDDAENVGAIASAPFTAGQSKRLVSKSGQDSGLGNISGLYSDLWRDADIAGAVAGSVALAPQALAGQAAPGSVTPAVAAEAAPSTTATLAQGTLSGGETAAVPASAPEALAGTAGATPAPAAADTAAYGLAPGQTVDSATGSVITPGPGTGAADVSAVAGKGWIESNPITSIIGANMLGGAAQGYANRRTQLELAQKKHDYEMEQADLPRKTKQGNASVGGGGVNIPIKPGGKILKRPDGTPVFVPGTGIINGSMNGVRG